MPVLLTVGTPRPGDLVEDSEPEREEQRRRERAARKARKQAFMKQPPAIQDRPSLGTRTWSESHPPSPASIVHDPDCKHIILNDDKDMDTPPAETAINLSGNHNGHIPSSPSVIEVLQRMASPSRLMTPAHPPQRDSPELSRSPLIISPHPPTRRSPPIIDEEIIELSDEEETDSQMRKHLAMFTYAKPAPHPRPALSRVSSTAALSSSSSLFSGSNGLRQIADPRIPLQESVPPDRDIDTIPGEPSKLKAKGVAKTRDSSRHRFSMALTDAELARMSRCVSCELGWTARKTVVEKMKHVGACAKKNKLDDNTVVALIQQELARTPPPEPKGKGKAKAKTAEPAEVAPRTILEEIVEGPVPKKKGRRVEVQTTVVKPVDADPMNRNRFQDLIGSKIVSSSRSARQDKPEGSSDVELFPATQSFSGSKLALPRSPTTRGFTGSGLFLHDEGSMPPPTQPIQNSELGGKRSAGFGGSLFLPEDHGAPSAVRTRWDDKMDVPEMKARSQPNEDVSDDDVEMPPPMQTCAPSRLGSALVAGLLAPSDPSFPSASGRFSSKGNVVSPPIVFDVASRTDNTQSPSLVPILHSSKGQAHKHPSVQTTRGSTPEIFAVSLPHPPQAPRSISSTLSSTSSSVIEVATSPEPSLADHNISFSAPLNNVQDEYDYDHLAFQNDDDAYLHFEPDWDVRPMSSHSEREPQDSATFPSLPVPFAPPREKSTYSTVYKSKPREIIPNQFVRGHSSSAPSPEALLSREESLSKAAAKAVRANVTPERRERRSRSPSSLEGVEDLSVLGTTKKPKKTRKPRARARSKGDDLHDEMDDANLDRLDETMKALILGDEDLYLRILRYEPIHFDLFLALAQDAGFKSRGLKLKLRPVLDGMAIHFYGFEGVGRVRTQRK